MSTIPYENQTQDWDNPRPDQEWEEPTTPGRPRRWLNRKSAALAAVITCAAGFYGGVRVEKSQLSSTATATTPAAAAGAIGASAGTAEAGAGARAGFAGGAAGGGGNASFGTVSSVNGNTIYLTDSSGNTVKVTLSSATEITKNQSVSKTSIRPGDAVVIQGAKSSSGTITATSVSDSGARATGSGAATTGSGSSPTSTGTAG
jgi:hypothetical protein